MTHKVFARTVGEGIIIGQPAWFDRARPMRVTGSRARRVDGAWVLTLADGTTLTEAGGELTSTEADVKTIDGLSVFAETEDALLERIIAKLMTIESLPRSAYIIMENSQVPTDFRKFRDAWEVDTDHVEVNMTKARVAHLTEIRRVRNQELAAKDVTFMRAVEAGDASAQSTIGTEKQTLRDLPATFDITTDVDTPAQLLAKWPSELPDRA